MAVRKLGWVVVALALTSGVFWFAGALLPVGHVAARRVPVTATPEALFALLIDVEHYPQWRDGVTATQRLPSFEGRTRFVEVSGRDSLTFEILDATAPRRLVTRIVGEGLPFGGQWVYDVEPAGDGSRLTITEHGDVYSPRFRLVSRYIIGHTRTIDSYLGSVVRHFGGNGTVEDAAPVPRAAP